MEPTLPAYDDGQPPRGITRRTIMKGAAWSVPVIAFAAPAMAATVSPDYYTLLGIGSFSGNRCGSLNSDASFCVYQQGNPLSQPMKIKVTLPAGLQFTDGSQVKILDVPGTDGSNCVAVPPFTATGAAGSYAITGELLDSAGNPVNPADTAQVTGQITAAPGAIWEFRAKPFSSNWPIQSVTTYTRTIDGVTASQGWIAGNNVGNALAAAVVGGEVKYWYTDGGNPWTGGTASPGTLSGVTGATLVSTYSANASGGSEGGVTTNGSSVWQWYAPAGGTPTLVTLSGISGSVLDVQAHTGRCYVRTTTGLYTWATATSGSSVSASLIPGSGPHPIAMSSFQDDGLSPSVTGVAVILGATTGSTSGQLGTWTGSGALSPVSGADAGDVRWVSATSSGLVAIAGSDDTLYTYGGYVTAGDWSNSGWAPRATGVTTATAWGYGGYFGGLYVTPAGVVQFNAAGSKSAGAFPYGEMTPGGLGGKTITKVFSSDGTYLALASDGTVFYWYGNNDFYQAHSGTPTASAASGLGYVVDLDVWGYHQNKPWPGHNNPNNLFYGGGVVIQGEKC